MARTRLVIKWKHKLSANSLASEPLKRCDGRTFVPVNQQPAIADQKKETPEDKVLGREKNARRTRRVLEVPSVRQRKSSSQNKATIKRRVTHRGVVTAAGRLRRTSPRIKSGDLEGVIIELAKPEISQENGPGILFPPSSDTVLGKSLASSGNQFAESDPNPCAAQDEMKDGKKPVLQSPELFCSCRKPENGKAMMKCSNDECVFRWYHVACMGLKSAADGM